MASDDEQEKSEGFYVVFSEVLHKNLVIPQEWIYDYSNAKQSNNGLNGNQDYLMFYTTKVDGHKKGIPKSTYDPNFGAKLLTSATKVPESFTFLGNLMKSYGKYLHSPNSYQ